MNKYTLVLLVAFIFGCSQQAPVPGPESRAVHILDGPAVAAALQTSYLDTRHDCGSASTPAFLCSGILFRGTQESSSYHSWNPVPGKEGVSFSYLRKDANFTHLAVGSDNGFIFFPLLSAPAGKEHMQVLCSFPIDGNSWIREPPGCGQSSLYPSVSRRCQSQGISTAVQWKAHFDQGPSGASREQYIYSYVCSFDVRDQMNELGPSRSINRC